MTDNAIKETLAKVAGRVLEDAAFIFTDNLDESCRPAADSWIAEGVSLDFSGQVTGELHMWAADGFARYAAANMLGIEEDSDGARQKGMDALKEILNMIVGNFLTEQYGQKKIFNLGLPRQLPPDGCWQDCERAHALWLEAEGNVIMFVIAIKDGKA